MGKDSGNEEEWRFFRCTVFLCLLQLAILSSVDDAFSAPPHTSIQSHTLHNTQIPHFLTSASFAPILPRFSTSSTHSFLNSIPRIPVSIR